MNEYKPKPYITRIIDSYTKDAKKIYPGFQFGRRYSFYSGEEPTTCEFEFRFISSNLNDTEYQTKRNFDLIHYTSSVQNVCEIINSGYFRLSNLIALNDPQELRFVTKNLEMAFDEQQIERYQNHFFTGSFCKVTKINKPDDFSMWRLYGSDGFGAAIIFEVLNPLQEWSNFVLANVQYGEGKAVERFKRFMDFHNSFQKDNNNPIQNTPIALSALMALHKSKIWENEKEVRLLTHNEFNKYSLKNESSGICGLKHSIASNGKQYAYVELPLYDSKEYLRMEQRVSANVLRELMPIMKIKKVILGYRHDFEVLNNLTDIVNSEASPYNYQIHTQMSSLKKYMI